MFLMDLNEMIADLRCAGRLFGSIGVLFRNHLPQRPGCVHTFPKEHQHYEEREGRSTAWCLIHVHILLITAALLKLLNHNM